MNKLQDAQGRMDQIKIIKSKKTIKGMEMS